MTKSTRSVLLTGIVLTVLLSGCAPAPTPEAPTSIPTSWPAPTAVAAEATSTATLPPSDAGLPGTEVVPVEKLGTTFPWLPIDAAAKPSIFFFYFNLKKPPFDKAAARQAFAAAIDRQALAEIAKKDGASNPRPATTYLPPETLGRELYNAVGIPFNPARAKELLKEAGYAQASALPPVTLYISSARSDVPAFNMEIIDAIVGMWQQNLGVKVTVDIAPDIDTFQKQITSDPPQMFRLMSYAGNNDPDAFMHHFHFGAQGNYGGFANLEYDKLIEAAAKNPDPAERQRQYIQAERILCETEAAVLPLFHLTYP